MPRPWVAVICAALAGCATPRESDSPTAWKRCRQPVGLAAYDGAALVDDGTRGWIASVDSPTAAVPRILLHHDAWDTQLLTRPAVSTVIGTNPSLVRLDTTTLGLLYRSVRRDGSCQFWFRRFDVVDRRWSRPVQVTTAASMPLAGNARLLSTRAGTLLFPTAELAQPGVLASAGVVLYASADGGAHWRRQPLELGRTTLAPVLVEMPTGALLLVTNSLGMLHRAVSTDAGTTWSALEPIGIPAQESPQALVRLPDADALLLAWTEVQPHLQEAPPAIRSLRWALSDDAGRTWTAPRTLLARPGWSLRAPALCASSGMLHVALEASREAARSPLLRSLRLASQGDSMWVQLVPERVRDNLRTLVAHTLGRPQRNDVLFVECYLMRALVAAHTALAPFASEHADWLQTQRGLDLARDYADELVRRQQPTGYWSIGYKSRFIADMASCIGLFHSLAPHVDATRRQQYVTAATRFLAALQRDGLLHANGAVGIGRAEGQRVLVDRTPYTVATALAGAAARAWVYAETHEESYRAGSMASLRWLVSQIGADGSVPDSQNEPGLIAAGYTGEAWMASLPFLEADAARALAPVLQRHLGWVQRLQGRDGTWGAPGSGVRERAPLLVHLLVWADARGLAAAGVQESLTRAQATLDFDAWRADGVFAPGAEVYRALAGIPLAALVQGGPVF